MLTLQLEEIALKYYAGKQEKARWELKRCAVPMAGVSKYGSDRMGQFQLHQLDLPEEVKKDLSDAVSNSLAKSTWGSYKTAERLLATYCKENKIGFSLPVSHSVLLGFVHWLAYKKQLKAGTISSYLAGIKKLYVVNGIPEPNLRTDLVQMVLHGRKNIEAADRLRGNKQQRQPVTPDILLLLKNRLIHWQASTWDKVTSWTVATLLFHGALRGGELLSKSTEQFDPAFTLLRQDLKLVVDKEKGGQAVLQVKLKAPKEDKDTKALIVDIFQSNTSICPVRAFAKWEKMSKGDSQDQPAFRLHTGIPLTPRRFNEILKERLSGYIDDQKILAHSFRSGAASMMGCLGYSDKDVKAVGRWSSKAFETYIKLPRTKRIEVAKKLSQHGFNE